MPNRRLLFRRASPRPASPRDAGSAPHRPGQRRAPAAGEGLLAQLVQPWSNLPLYLSDHSLETWCGRGCSRSSSTASRAWSRRGRGRHAPSRWPRRSSPREIYQLPVSALLHADELAVLGDHRVVLAGLGREEAPVVIKAPRIGKWLNGPAGPCSPSGVRCHLPIPAVEYPFSFSTWETAPRRAGASPSSPGSRTKTRGSTHADRVVVAARQQRARVGEHIAVTSKRLYLTPARRCGLVRRRDRPAKNARIAKPRVVDQDDEDVGAPSGGSTWPISPSQASNPRASAGGSLEAGPANRKGGTVDQGFAHDGCLRWSSGGSRAPLYARAGSADAPEAAIHPGESVSSLEVISDELTPQLIIQVLRDVGFHLFPRLDPSDRAGTHRRTVICRGTPGSTVIRRFRRSIRSIYFPDDAAHLVLVEDRIVTERRLPLDAS